MPLELSETLIEKAYAARLKDFFFLLGEVFGIRCIQLPVGDFGAKIPLAKWGDVRPKSSWLPVHGASVDMDLLYGDAKAVSITRETPDVTLTASLFTTNPRGIKIEEKLGHLLCELSMQIIMARLVNGAVRGIEAADEPTSNKLLKNVYAADTARVPLTKAVLNQTRLRAGCRFAELTTLICHPEVIYDLLHDDDVFSDLQPVEMRDGVLYFGKVAVLPVEHGLVQEDPGGGDFVKFRSILAAHGTLGLAVNPVPVLNVAETEGVVTATAEFDFATAVFGMECTSDAQAADNTLDNAANWAERYSDPRNLLLAMGISNASQV